MKLLRRTWNVASAITLFVCLPACAFAFSQSETAPTPVDQPNANQDVETQHVLESIASKLRALREQAARTEERKSARDATPGPPIASNWVLIFVTGGAVIAAFGTLGQIKKQVAANIDAATAAKASADAVILAERAYISISHHPPGIDIDESVITKAGEEGFGGWHYVTVRFGIVNQGNTPADVTDISMNHVIGPPADLPPPPAVPGTGEHLFLV